MIMFQVKYPDSIEKIYFITNQIPQCYRALRKICEKRFNIPKVDFKDKDFRNSKTRQIVAEIISLLIIPEEIDPKEIGKLIKLTYSDPRGEEVWVCPSLKSLLRYFLKYITGIGCYLVGYSSRYVYFYREDEEVFFQVNWESLGESSQKFTKITRII